MRYLNNDSSRSVHSFQANSFLAPQIVSFSTHQVQRLCTAPQHPNATDDGLLFPGCTVASEWRANSIFLPHKKGSYLELCPRLGHVQRAIPGSPISRPAVRVFVRTCPRFIIAGPAHENDTWSLRQARNGLFLSRALWPANMVSNRTWICIKITSSKGPRTS